MGCEEKNVIRGRLFTVASMFIIFVHINLCAQVDTLWAKNYGGVRSDVGHFVQQTSDGGYVVVGYTESYGAALSNVWLIKTDSAGDTLWTTTFGGDSVDVGYGVQQTSDGGYIITGYTKSYGAGKEDVWLVKTSSAGNSLWTKTFGGDSTDIGYGVQQTSDGGYIVAGYTKSYGAGGNDFWLIKTNASGDTLWTKTFGGTGGEQCYAVLHTSDGGYVLIGYTTSYGAGLRDAWFVKASGSGDTLWTRTFGDVGNDVGSAVDTTSDGGYIITGHKDEDLWLLKTNTSGNYQWDKVYGAGVFDEGSSVKEANDGGYIVTGYLGSGTGDLWLFKSNSTGDSLWAKIYDGFGRWDKGNSIQQTSDQGYIITGYTQRGSMYDVWLLKTEPDIGIAEEIKRRVNVACKIYPNPASQVLNFDFALAKNSEVSIKIYDVSGSLVGIIEDAIRAEGHHQKCWPVGNLPAGVYFVEFRVGDYRAQEKVIILR